MGVLSSQYVNYSSFENVSAATCVRFIDTVLNSSDYKRSMLSSVPISMMGLLELLCSGIEHQLKMYGVVVEVLTGSLLFVTPEIASLKLEFVAEMAANSRIDPALLKA